MSLLAAGVDLPPVPASVPVARHLVLDLLRAWQAPHDAGDVVVLVTELVADVVDHVAGEASFTLELTRPSPTAGAWTTTPRASASGSSSPLPMGRVCRPGSPGTAPGADRPRRRRA